MATNKLVAYWIRLRERGSDDNFWDLSKMYKHEPGIYYNDIIDLFEDFCRIISRKTYVDEKNEETIQMDFFERDGQIIEGEFSKGNSGLIADHYDTEKDQRERLARQENISEEIPYYFLFYRLPSNSDRALLILREYGGKGAKRAITNILKPIIRGVTKQGIYEDSAVITEDARKAIKQADRIASLKLKGEERLRSIDQVAEQENVEEKESQNITETIHITPEEGGAQFGCT